MNLGETRHLKRLDKALTATIVRARGAIVTSLGLNK